MYAEAEPTDHLGANLDILREDRGAAVPDFTSRVRDLVVVLSSSRGGSSMLAELLRRSCSLIHLRAEINPFLRLVGLAFPESGTGSDELDASHWRGLSPGLRQLFDRELALDAGRPCDAITDHDQFLLDAAWRFTVQWPDLQVDLGTWIEVARSTLTALQREHGWRQDELRDISHFQIELIRGLRARGIRVNPWCYDLPRALVRSAFPDVTERCTPSRGHLIEEPPFVAPRIWQRADEQDLAERPLVIKTPSNAYRIPFLRAMFPNARIRLIHLTRNPAAAINGLRDGWRHRGFHAHHMREPVRIAGYGDEHPGERSWWKFDLPPGWQRYTTATLPEVCAFQWRSAHEAIRRQIDRGDLEVNRLRYEDLLASPASRATAIEKLTGWLGIPFEGALRAAAHDGLEPIVATAPPEPSRWRAREAMVRAVIDDDVHRTAEWMGYGDERNWI